MENKLIIILIVSALGAGCLFGIFRQMKDGFGPFNLKVYGLTLTIIMTVIVSLSDSSSDKSTACFSVLGAFAGYLFGLKKE